MKELKCDGCGRSCPADRAMHCPTCGKNYCEACARRLTLCECSGELWYYD